MEFAGWFTIFFMLPGIMAAAFVEDTMNLGSGLGQLAGFVTLLAWWFFLVYIVIQLMSMVIL
jgi:hypothetical protein